MISILTERGGRATWENVHSSQPKIRLGFPPKFHIEKKRLIDRCNWFCNDFGTSFTAISRRPSAVAGNSELRICL
jgi:hypothetical protein